MSQPKQQHPLIDALLTPAPYSHPVDSIELIETHISWVILTGQYAYKIKKPVDFGFVDFTTLDKRHFYCKQEVILNKRLAPEIYLGVVAITGTESRPTFDGEGPALEYAVKMLQFSQSGLMSEQIRRNKVSFDDMQQLAETIARFHSDTPIADMQSEFGNPEAIHAAMHHNFQIVRPTLKDPADTSALDHVEHWSETRFEQLRPVYRERKQQQHVRECHGDLHSGNITRYQDAWMAFDCIEFNQQFRWIDTISEVAFLLMDLDEHGKPELASHFLNAYLHISGDFDGLRVLRLYRVYRAMVRAKVAALQLDNQPDDSEAYASSLATLQSYLELAGEYTRARSPRLFLMYGLSGSGKSWLAERVSHGIHAIWIRSDLERKRLFPDEGDKLYSTDITEQVYKRLYQLAEMGLESGYDMVVDATFLKRAHRQLFYTLAEKQAVTCCIIHCHSHQNILEDRIRQRQLASSDISDADVSVLHKQLDAMEELTDDETNIRLMVDTGNTESVSDLIERRLLSIN